MMRELISSVRDTNRRLEEISFLMDSGAIKKEKEGDIISRYKRLTDTRLCLINSIYDMRQQFIDKIATEDTRERIEENFSLQSLYRDLTKV